MKMKIYTSSQINNVQQEKLIVQQQEQQYQQVAFSMGLKKSRNCSGLKFQGKKHCISCSGK